MFEIVIDVREHALIEKVKEIVPAESIKIETAALLLGDVLFRIDTTTEIILFERKTFTDLLASIKDGRYEEQSHRLIHTSGLHPHNIIYVIEGIYSTIRNPVDKKIITSAMTSLSYFKGFSVFRTSTVFETAELILSMANKIQKEFEKGKPIPTYSSIISQQHSEEPIASYGNFVKKSKRENITPQNIGEILLSQIPGVSNHIATEILKHFGGSFSQLIEEIRTTPEKLDSIYLESGTNGKRRKLSSAVIQSILRYLIDGTKRENGEKEREKEKGEREREEEESKTNTLA
jgi:ERCC4-type nuclease